MRLPTQLQRQQFAWLAVVAAATLFGDDGLGFTVPVTTHSTSKRVSADGHIIMCLTKLFKNDDLLLHQGIANVPEGRQFLPTGFE